MIPESQIECYVEGGTLPVSSYYLICLLELRETAKTSAKLSGFLTGIKRRTFRREVSNVIS